MLLTWEDLQLFKNAIRAIPKVEQHCCGFDPPGLLREEDVLKAIEEVARGHRPPQP